ncbi:MAG TPA: hypothetical protein VFE65_36930 [Pseudonocardia sp.]|nr:hypothetical protein [Pseudonocardia sp.]
MQFLIALAAAAVVGFLLWKLVVTQPSDESPRSRPPQRATAPDDDVEFLQQLDERMKRGGDDPPARS